MSSIKLYIPKVDDYWYYEMLLNDKDTMSYNAGYDISNCRYHYDTGCIDFPKERWDDFYKSIIDENRFFAYIKDSGEFVGYVNYHYNNNENRYECGIVIEASKRGKGYSKVGLKLLCDEARNNGIKELYDNFEVDRVSALKVFEEVGFEVVERKEWKKFKKLVEGVVVRIML